MSKLSTRLFVSGLSHHRTPLELRERIALTPEEQRRFATAMAERLGEEPPLILNTCNRIEVYGCANGVDPGPYFLELLAEVKSLDIELLAPLAYHRFNHEMLLHLFSVAAGIDSQMIGETEILGQLKEAHRQAREHGDLPPGLDQAFQKSFQTAKWARTSTGISQGQVSIGNLTAELAIRLFGSLRRTRVLLIGSGEVATLTAEALVSRGCRDLTVASRRLEKATELARQLKAAALAIENVYDHLNLYDVVIASTSAPEPIFEAEPVSRVIGSRDRPLFFVDLAVPRDVASPTGDLDGVFLYNLEDLSRIANENLENRRAEIARCEVELSRRAWNTWLKIYRILLKKKSVLSNAAPTEGY